MCSFYKKEKCVYLPQKKKRFSNYLNHSFMLKPYFLYFFLIVLLISATSCNKIGHKAPQILPAFYHWKGEFSLSEEEKSYLKSLNIKKLYVRYFDVDWDEGLGQVVPKSNVSLSKEKIENMEYIPTVFITNRTLQKIDERNSEVLAEKIAAKIVAKSDSAHYNFQEVQMDCDWSDKTRANYWALLKALRKRLAALNLPNVKISATIRLHQIKYPEKTGVPPVDKGMLMYYNMSDVSNMNTKNSILNNEEGEKYLGKLGKYPLKLEVALPIFSWGVVNRNGKMVSLLPSFTADSANKSQFESISPTQFRVTKSHYQNGVYLYEDDLIRTETVTQNDLYVAQKQILSRLANDSVYFAFYHLSPENIQHFPKDSILQICQHKF